MPAIRSLLAAKPGQVLSGEVQRDLGNGYYAVSLNGKVRSVKSTLPAALQVGASVVVADTGTSVLIIGSEGNRGRQKEEVFIEG